jgi:hypothetical protein
VTPILAIDPGTRQSGWAVLDATEAALAAGKDDNGWLLERIASGTFDRPSGPVPVGHVVIEVMDRIFGPSDATVIETLIWTGRFLERAPSAERIAREVVLTRLFGKVVRNADAVVHRFLVDRYAERAGDPLGGRAAAVGTVKAPGPLHGVKADAWQAIAVGIAWLTDTREDAR